MIIYGRPNYNDNLKIEYDCYYFNYLKNLSLFEQQLQQSNNIETTNNTGRDNNSIKNNKATYNKLRNPEKENNSA